MRERPGADHARDDDDDNDGYLDLARLARYSGLSLSTLRRYLHDPEHPLPHYDVRLSDKARGRVLVRKSEFHAWVRSAFPAAPAADPTPDPAHDVGWIRRAFDK